MGQKVLLIDDSPAIHALVRARLVNEPISLHCVGGGEEGLALAGTLLPDLILLDVDMPAPDGFEVCRRLKQNDKTSAIPVVFLTGVSSTQEKIRGLELGAVDYVTKPFNPAELCARVRASLRTKYLMDLLSQKARIDGLTGLWNRAHFDERLKQEQSLSRRTGFPLSLVMADADRFKSINDKYGHPFGDEVLRRIAAVLSAIGRTEDSICRLGGEEFVLLCPNSNAAGAQILASRCREGINQLQLNYHDQIVRISCSFGVAQFQPDEVSMLDAADKALYEAKRQGRDRVIVAEGSTAQAAPTAAPALATTS
jgi:diguanylate cyclase (GGDEF)-like protein